jgi:hypothetical protein
MTRGCDRRKTCQVHSTTESRLKYKYGDLLRLKNYSNVRGSSASEDIRHAGLRAYQMTEEAFKTHTSDWRLSCYASPPLQSKQQTMNQAVRNFRASVPCSMWKRDIRLIHKEITGLSQVTWTAIHWPPDNPLSTTKLAYMYVCVCVCVCVCACVNYLCVRFTFVVLITSVQNTRFQVSTTLMFEF